MQAGPDGTEDRKRRYEHAAEKIMLAGALGLTAEALLPGFGAPGWVLPASEIIAGWGSGFIAWNGTGRKLLPAYLGAFGTFLGSWSIAAGAWGLWTWDAIGAWLAGVTVMIPLGIAAVHQDDGGREPLAIEMAEPEKDPDQEVMDQFEYMFSELGAEKVIVLAVEETTGGRVLQLRLPNSGRVTIDTLRSLTPQIEVILEMAPGTVGFETAANSALVIMRLREKDSLSGSRTLTPDLRISTVNEAFPVGDQEDGSLNLISVRERHGFGVGTTGSGKSNLVNIFVDQLSHCVDTVIWMIDMKGGRAARPWFQAWSEGRADAPPIDWLATTREEAAMMMEAILAAVEIRMRSGIGMNKIVPSGTMPQIELICDEMADLLGSERGTRTEVGDDAKTNSWFIGKAEIIGQKGRSEAVGSMWFTQRGTNSMSGSGDLKSLCELRIALKPATSGDLQWVIPDASEAAKKTLMGLVKFPGVGMTQNGPKVSGVTKFFHDDHIEGQCGADEINPRCVQECPIYQSALEVGNIRPQLDSMTASALGPAYEDRWKRAAENGIIRVPVAALSGGRNRIEAADYPGAFEEIVSGFTDPYAKTHPGLLRMREFLAFQGAMGASVSMILEDLLQQNISVARETVHKWLRKDRKDGTVHNPDYGRWKYGEGPNWRTDDDETDGQFG